VCVVGWWRINLAPGSSTLVHRRQNKSYSTRKRRLPSPARHTGVIPEHVPPQTEITEVQVRSPLWARFAVSAVDVGLLWKKACLRPNTSSGSQPGGGGPRRRDFKETQLRLSLNGNPSVNVARRLMEKILTFSKEGIACMVNKMFI